MSAKPWMPFYVADYLADTGHLSTIEHGAYILLIMHYWQRGGLPDDDRLLARICRLSTEEWQESRPILQDLFSEGWRHGRIDDELAKADDISTKRKAAAQQRHSKSNASAPANGGASAEQKQTQSHTQSHKRDAYASPKGADDDFEDWYAGYPHKVGKAAALKAFKAAIRKTDLDTLKAARDRYILEKPEDRSWCNPATWLNQERWLDAPAAAPSPPQPGGPAPLPAADSVQLLNHNEASRAAVIRKVIRYRRGEMQEWRFTPQWSDDHPPGHPHCVIPQDIIDEADRQFETETKRRAAG